MARFTETVNIGQAPVIQDDRSSLINRLENFSSQQSQIRAQQVTQNALAEGQAAFVEGEDPEFKKERFFGKVKASAFNEGMRAAYVAGIDRDNRLEVSRIAKENETDLAKFNDEVAAYQKSVIANVDPSARQLVQNSLDSLVSANRVKVQNNDIERRHRENAQEVEAQIGAATDDALGFARDGDIQSSAESGLAAFASVDAAEQAGFVSPEEAKFRKREIEKGMTEEAKLGGLFQIFEAEGEQASYLALDEMSKKRPKGFSPEEWDSFIAKSQAHLNRKAARVEREAIASAKRSQMENDFSAIEQRIAGDDAQIINPKVADAYYQQVLAPELQNQPPEVREAATAQYIDRLKLVPNTVVAQITNAANSNNPTLLSEAASLIDRIDEIPGVINKVPTQQQAYISEVVDLMQNMSESEAVELARKATDPKDKARIEAVEVNLKEQIKDDPDIFLDKSQAAFAGPLIFDDPNINEVASHQMSKEYRALYESFRKAGSTESTAFKKADSFIKRNWGVSNVLGKREVMKYPPEDYYAIDGDTEWIKPQLMKDLSSAISGLEIDDVFLMSNDRTARTAETGQPSYSVKIMSDGVFYNIEDNWFPDKNLEIERRKTENVTEAMKRRQKRANIGLQDAIILDRQSKGLF